MMWACGCTQTTPCESCAQMIRLADRVDLEQAVIDAARVWLLDGGHMAGRTPCADLAEALIALDGE